MMEQTDPASASAVEMANQGFWYYVLYYIYGRYRLVIQFQLLELVRGS